MKHNKSRGEDKLERELSPEETENLLGFFRLLLKIDRRMKGQNSLPPHSAKEAMSEAGTKLVEPGQTPESPRMDEEAKSWDVNIPSDGGDENRLFQAEVAKNLSSNITIRLDSDTLHQVRTLARQKGIGPTTLIRMSVMERLGY